MMVSTEQYAKGNKNEFNIFKSRDKNGIAIRKN